VEIDPTGSGLLSSQQRDIADPSGAEYLETQIQILKSDALAMKVIRELKLDQKRAFVGAAAPIYQFTENQPRPIDPQLVVPPVARPMAVVDIEPIESSEESGPVIDAPASTIERLRAERAGADTKVLIQGDGRLDGKLMRSTLPGRLILDFRGVRLHVDAQSGAWTRNNDLPGLGGIRSGQFRPDVARVVLDLREPVEYVVTPDRDAIVVTLKTPDHNLGSLAEPGSNSAPPAAAREAERRESADTAGGARSVGFLNPNDALAAASLPERRAEEVDSTKQIGQGVEAVSRDGERTPNENLALRFFRQNLTVSTSRNSRIVEVSLASSDPQLATEATNTLVHSFIDSDYRTRYETTMRSSDWLTEQLASLREKVRENNQALAEYQKQTGVLDPEEKDNPLLAKANELNRQYSQAEADRIQSEAYTRAADEGNADSLPQIRDNLLIQSLSQRLAESRAQLARALTIYGENNSNVKRLRGESDELSAQLGTAKRAMVGGLKANYKAALTRERLMAQAAEEMKTTLGSMDEKMAQYRLLKNQAQTSTELFNTLQSRLKEAGIYAGL
ncbi:MAG: AMIN domain-containing protein, partial [Candidatus Acidiferrales bacterium]